MVYLQTRPWVPPFNQMMSVSQSEASDAKTSSGGVFQVVLRLQQQVRHPGTTEESVNRPGDGLGRRPCVRTIQTSSATCFIFSTSCYASSHLNPKIWILMWHQVLRSFPTECWRLWTQSLDSWNIGTAAATDFQRPGTSCVAAHVLIPVSSRCGHRCRGFLCLKPAKILCPVTMALDIHKSEKTFFLGQNPPFPSLIHFQLLQYFIIINVNTKLKLFHKEVCPCATPAGETLFKHLD